MFSKKQHSGFCGKCGNTYSGDLSKYFSKLHSGNSGLGYVCKSCRSDYSRSSECKKYMLDYKESYYLTTSGRSRVLFDGAKSREVLRDRGFDIDVGYIESLFSDQDSKCCLTGIPFEMCRSKIYYHNPYAPSLDRIDSSLGYLRGNVRLVLSCVNVALGQWGSNFLSWWLPAYLGFGVLERCFGFLESVYKNKLDGTQKYKAIYLTSSVINRAKKKSIPCEINLKYVNSLFEKQSNSCLLTKIPFNFNRLSMFNRNPLAASLDRIDPKLGYIRENVRLVLSCVNTALGEWGDSLLSKWSPEYLIKQSSEELRDALLAKLQKNVRL